MADRYWVGGTADWNAVANIKWATTSGGVGGAAVPTASDDVFFDANSGAAVVTINTAHAYCRSLNCTGFTGTLDGNTTILYVGDGTTGHFTLGSGMTFSHAFSIQFVSSTTGNQITLNGVSLGAENIAFNGVGGAWTIMDALVLTGTLNLTKGTLDTNGVDVTCGVFQSTGSNTRALTLGASTFTCSGTGSVWNVTSSLVLDAGTSTIAFSDTSLVSKTFAGAGLTYYDVEFASTGNYIVTGSNTFSTMTLNAPCNLYLAASSTQTILQDFVAIGTASSRILLGGFATSQLSKTSGTITVHWCDIQDSTTGGGATFKASDSADLGGNSGWQFVGSNQKSMLQFFASS